MEFSDCPSFMSLSPQHQLFVAEFVRINIDGEKAPVEKAASKAKIGGKAPSQVGSRLLKTAKIAAAIKEIKAKLVTPTIADAQELREFWSSVLRGDIGEVCSWNDGGLSFNSTSIAMPKDTRRLIKKISVKEKTSPKGDYTEVQTSVELHDPLRASELLARDLGMLKDKTDLNVSGCIEIKVKGRPS